MESYAKTKVLHRMLCGILGTALSGCDVPPDPNALKPTTDWFGVPCDENNKMDLLSGLDATEEADGLMFSLVGGQIGRYVQEVGGTRCGNATDVDLCNQTVDLMLREIHTNSLIITQGDMVQVLVTEDEVKAYLGQLDNPEKVFSWMHLHGMSLSCKFDDSAVVSSDDGQSWKGVYTELTQICAPVVKERVRVNVNIADWSITETARAEIRREENVCIGRKPPGELRFSNVKTVADCNSLGRTLARHAAYEAASVVAFEHLRSELALFGAPQHLLDRITWAADDERRHAVQVRMLANRYSQDSEDFSVEPAVIRDIESIAIDNMHEGCVGESWGALVGLYQAENAKDPVIAETMGQIALDEVEHASLSWAIHDWLFPQLDEAARERVTLAKCKALKKLMLSANRTVGSTHTYLAGFPEPHIANRLAERFVQSLMA